jgi:hypothetical protein
MSQIDQLGEQIRLLKREVYEASILAKALGRLYGPERVRGAVNSLKFDEQTYIGKAGLEANARKAIERFLGDPMKDIATLEDLQFFERAEIAELEGVGPKTMDALDRAMNERHLSWAVTV